MVRSSSAASTSSDILADRLDSQSRYKACIDSLNDIANGKLDSVPPSLSPVTRATSLLRSFGSSGTHEDEVPEWRVNSLPRPRQRQLSQPPYCSKFSFSSPYEFAPKSHAAVLGPPPPKPPPPQWLKFNSPDDVPRGASSASDYHDDEKSVKIAKELAIEADAVNLLKGPEPSWHSTEKPWLQDEPTLAWRPDPHKEEPRNGSRRDPYKEIASKSKCSSIANLPVEPSSNDEPVVKSMPYRSTSCDTAQKVFKDVGSIVKNATTGVKNIQIKPSNETLRPSYQSRSSERDWTTPTFGSCYGGPSSGNRQSSTDATPSRPSYGIVPFTPPQHIYPTRSDRWSQPAKEVTISTLVSGEAEKPAPRPELEPAWHKAAQEKQAAWERRGSDVNPEYKPKYVPLSEPTWTWKAQQKRSKWDEMGAQIDPRMHPPALTPPHLRRPSWADKAENTHRLWQQESDQFKQQRQLQELSTAAPPAITKPAPTPLTGSSRRRSRMSPLNMSKYNTESSDPWKPASIGSLTNHRQDEASRQWSKPSSDNQVNDQKDLVSGSKSTGVALPSPERNNSPLALRQFLTGFNDSSGKLVDYNYSIIKAKDPNDHSSLRVLTEQEKRVAEELVPKSDGGIIKRRSTDAGIRKTTITGPRIPQPSLDLPGDPKLPMRSYGYVSDVKPIDSNSYSYDQVAAYPEYGRFGTTDF